MGELPPCFLHTHTRDRTTVVSVEVPTLKETYRRTQSQGVKSTDAHGLWYISSTNPLYRERRQVSLEPTLVHLAVGRLCQVRKVRPRPMPHTQKPFCCRHSTVAMGSGSSAPGLSANVRPGSSHRSVHSAPTRRCRWAGTPPRETRVVAFWIATSISSSSHCCVPSGACAAAHCWMARQSGSSHLPALSQLHRLSEMLLEMDPKATMEVPPIAESESECLEPRARR